MDERDPYRTLGVAAGTDPAALRRAFHQAALRYHPDRMGAEGVRLFQDALWAYQTLLEEARRRGRSVPVTAAPARAAPAPVREPRWPRAEPLVPRAAAPRYAAEPFAPEPLVPTALPSMQTDERAAALRWLRQLWSRRR